MKKNFIGVTAILLLMTSFQYAMAADSGSAGVGAEGVLSLIQQAMQPAVTKLTDQAVRWLAAFAALQYVINMLKQLNEGDLQSALAKTFLSVAWVGVCLYIMENGPTFIAAVGDQFFGLAGDLPTPGSIMKNTFGLSAAISAIAVGVGGIPLVGATAGNIMTVVLLLVVGVGMYFAFKIFMLQLEVGLVVMMSPLSFSFLGLNALRDQGIAPFKSMLALAYRIVIVGVIMAAFTKLNESVSSVILDLDVTKFADKGIAGVVEDIASVFGAYVLLAFLLFKSDSVAASLASGSASLSSSDMTAAVAAGAAAGAAAATGGASLAATAGKVPQSMAEFMDKLDASAGTVSNASPFGSGGTDTPVFTPPAPSLSVGGGQPNGSASMSSPPQRSSPSRLPITSGRYGPALPGQAGHVDPSDTTAPASGSGSTAGIGSPPADRDRQLKERAAQANAVAPRRPTMADRLRDVDRHLQHEKATTHVAISSHHS